MMDPQNAREAQARFLRKQVPHFQAWTGLALHMHTGKRRAKTTPVPLPRCLQRISILCEGVQGLKFFPPFPFGKAIRGLATPLLLLSLRTPRLYYIQINPCSTISPNILVGLWIGSSISHPALYPRGPIPLHPS